MKKASDARVLVDICGEIRREGRIADSHITRLSEAFGPRLKKALEAVEEGRIKKYIFQPSGRVVWIVVGREREYLVMPTADFCSCDDFYFQFDRGHLCYHIIAQKLAEALGRFDLIVEEDAFYDVFIEEWKAAETKTSKGSKGKMRTP